MVKNILFVSHKYLPAIGGMEQHCYHLIEGIKMLDYTCHYIIIKPNQSALHFLINIRKKVKNYLQKHPEINVVYVNEGLLGIILADLKKSSDIKFYVTVHGLEAVFPNSLYKNRLLPRLSYYDKIICVSKFTANALIGNNIDENKISIIPNGTSIQKKESQINSIDKKKIDEQLGNKKILLSVGRPVKRKGFSWFATNVVPLLTEEFLYVIIGPRTKKDWKFDLLKKIIPKNLYMQIVLAFGHPIDADNIENLVSDQVLYLGKMDQAVLDYIIEKADLFIIPNIEVEGDVEGFGLVALEASFRGKVVLAADLQGLKDAVHNWKNGILLKSGDQHLWAKYIMMLVDNKILCQEIGLTASEYTITTFSWQKMAYLYDKVFSS